MCCTPQYWSSWSITENPQPSILITEGWHFIGCTHRWAGEGAIQVSWIYQYLQGHKEVRVQIRSLTCIGWTGEKIHLQARLTLGWRVEGRVQYLCRSTQTQNSSILWNQQHPRLGYQRSPASARWAFTQHCRSAHRAELVGWWRGQHTGHPLSPVYP